MGNCSGTKGSYTVQEGHVMGTFHEKLFPLAKKPLCPKIDNSNCIGKMPSNLVCPKVQSEDVLIWAWAE